MGGSSSHRGGGSSRTVPPRPARLVLLMLGSLLAVWIVRTLLGMDYNSNKWSSCRGKRSLASCLLQSTRQFARGGDDNDGMMGTGVAQQDDSIKFTPSDSIWQQNLKLAEEDREATSSLVSAPGGSEDDDGNDGTIERKKQEQQQQQQLGDKPARFKPLTPDTLAWKGIFRLGRVLNSSLGDPAADRWNGSTLEERGIPINSGVHVITTFFKGSYHDRRFKEIMATLVSNLENPSIAAVHLLCQGADPRQYLPTEVTTVLIEKNLDSKLVLSFVHRQPTYRNMFEYVNRNLQRGSVAVVTNADIYFGQDIKCAIGPSLDQLEKKPSSGRVAIALTRRHSPLCKGKADHQSTYDLCETYVGSHDSFILAPPIARSVVLHTAHTQNQGFGAENIVIYELRKAGYKVFNPCYNIHGFHFHCSPERHYALHIINKDPPRPGSAYPIRRFSCPVTVF